MNCKMCGLEIKDDDALYCARCGTRIERKALEQKALEQMALEQKELEQFLIEHKKLEQTPMRTQTSSNTGSEKPIVEPNKQPSVFPPSTISEKPQPPVFSPSTENRPPSPKKEVSQAEGVSEKNTLVWFASFIASGVVVVSSCVAFFYISKGTYDSSWAWAAIIGWGIFFVLIMVNAYSNQCPSCNALWARNETDKEAIDRQRGYKTVTRKDEVRNSRGDVIGTTERQEQIRVMKVTYRHYYKCGNCGHKWTGTSKSEYENFTE